MMRGQCHTCGFPGERRVTMTRQKSRRVREYCDGCAAVYVPELLALGWVVRVSERIGTAA